MSVPEEQQGWQRVRRGRGLQELKVLREQPWALAGVSWLSLSSREREEYLRDHADDETLLLDLVRLDGLVVLQNLTRVDELLCRRLPALLGCDL